MPELPEVETVAADLRPLVTGRTITGCRLGRPGMVRHPEPEAFADAVVGRTVAGLERRGKYLLFRLAGGEGVLVIHLGMTGRLRCVPPDQPELPHTHLALDLDDGRQLRFADPRRFGRVLLGGEAELVAAGRMPRLGPEPIDPAFTAAELGRRLRGRRAAVKALLLDQGVVAGVGNIYADESCFRARVRPDRPAGSLSPAAIRRLRAALADSLAEGIANRGSSVGDYRDLWGRMGQQQERLQVYGHGGEPCPRCGRVLPRARVAGRTTVFCRRCQR